MIVCFGIVDAKAQGHEPEEWLTIDLQTDPGKVVPNVEGPLVDARDKRWPSHWWIIQPPISVCAKVSD